MKELKKAIIELRPNKGIVRHAHRGNGYGSIVLTLTGFCERDTWYTIKNGKWDNEDCLIITRTTHK